MPSGHSYYAAFACIFWIMFLSKNYPKDSYYYFSVFFVICLTVLILYSRHYLGCHTVQQIIAGTLIGSLVGYIGYKIYEKTNEIIEKKKKEQQKINENQRNNISINV